MRPLLVGFLAVTRAYIAPRPTSRPVPRPASPITDEEIGIDLDWRSFRAKLEATGLDATAREQWADDAWAHALPRPEAGGLLLALPFSATLCHAKSPWFRDVRRFASKKRFAAARALGVPMKKRNYADGDRRHRTLARQFATIELRRVAETPVHARTLKDRQFLNMRDEAIRRARDVVLVLDDEGACIRLGRQDRGAPWGSRRRSAALFAALEVDGHFPDFHDFQAAFGDEVTVYTGSRTAEDWEGVAWSGEALVLHTRNLEGSTELAPGCGIYRGGAAHAARLVCSGEADAAEFAFFVGRYEFAEGELAEAIGSGLYQPAACSSAQVLSGERDASLWHALMRKLGGSSADIEMLAPKLPVCASDTVDGPDECLFGDS